MNTVLTGMIGFEGLKICCIIGTEAYERENEQEIYVDLKVKADLLPAARSDDLKQALDYTQLAEICKQCAQNNYFLLEAYAAAVLQEVTGRFQVEWVGISVRKPKAIPGAEAAFVELSNHILALG